MISFLTRNTIKNKGFKRFSLLFCKCLRPERQQSLQMYHRVVEELNGQREDRKTARNVATCHPVEIISARALTSNNILSINSNSKV